MKHEDIEKVIECAIEKARYDIQDAADLYRQYVLVPFCKKYKLTYLAGNGTFWFYNEKDETVYSWDLPELESINKTLDLHTTGANEVFGLYVQNITEEDIGQLT